MFQYRRSAARVIPDMAKLCKDITRNSEPKYVWPGSTQTDLSMLELSLRVVLIVIVSSALVWFPQALVVEKIQVCA